MIGQSHDCKRNGTTTLFAALNVGTGKVTGRHCKRRRRLEFVDFMNCVVKQHEGQEVHVVLDIWFSILSGKSLKGGSFGGVPELTVHIDAFITNYNEEAWPFVWTKSVVHQKRMKPCFAV